MGKKSKAKVQRKKQTETGRRNVVVYAPDGRVAVATIKTTKSKEAALRSLGMTRTTSSSAGSLFLERGSYPEETSEDKDEVFQRLEREGYTVVGNRPYIHVPRFDSGAWIYSIERNGECYIGWTASAVADRLKQHARDQDCTAARVLEGCDRVRLLEHYCPGTWTKDGVEKREAELINQTPGCINDKKNEAMRKD